MGNIYFYLLVLCPSLLLAIRAEKRTLECNKVCKAIRFAGKIGGCNCNYVMFTKRSSEFSRSFETEIDNLEQLMENIPGISDADESTDYEGLDEKKDAHQNSQLNIIDLLRRQVMRPVERDRDY
ncbi:uncharacterized protein CDAR_388711 [Caerostris darwini]|uniref:Uncharacterized protein n=1 Tax=Caerostris darwini TaxID=1538125 RepID=A0AAV4S439_9ARAC|nr:uncharacterized protein CDAR_388711 [Caerostris darwini]